MPPSLVTVGALVVTGAGVITSLLTSQQGSDRTPPKWLEKMKGQKGVMFLNKNTTGKTELCDAIKKLVEKGNDKLLKNPETFKECSGLRSQDENAPGNEHYFGLYFEKVSEIESCTELKSRDQVVIYVEESNKKKYEGNGFSEWNKNKDCRVKEGGEKNTFLIGGREDLINLWLNTGKIFKFLLLFLIKER